MYAALLRHPPRVWGHFVSSLIWLQPFTSLHFTSLQSWNNWINAHPSTEHPDSQTHKHISVLQTVCCTWSGVEQKLAALHISVSQRCRLETCELNSIQTAVTWLWSVVKTLTSSDLIGRNKRRLNSTERLTTVDFQKFKAGKLWLSETEKEQNLRRQQRQRPSGLRVHWQRLDMSFWYRFSSVCA